MKTAKYYPSPDYPLSPGPCLRRSGFAQAGARGEGVIGLFSDQSVLWILEEGVGREDEEKLGRP